MAQYSESPNIQVSQSPNALNSIDSVSDDTAALGINDNRIYNQTNVDPDDSSIPRSLRDQNTSKLMPFGKNLRNSSPEPVASVLPLNENNIVADSDPNKSDSDTKKQDSFPILESPGTEKSLFNRRHKSSSNKPSNENDNENTLLPTNSNINAPSYQKHRRKSSLESFPLIGSYFTQKRLEQSVEKYNYFAAEMMKLLLKCFTSHDHESIILLSYEIAYFCKIFELPVPVSKSYKNVNGANLSLAGATATVMTSVTKSTTSTSGEANKSLVHGSNQKVHPSLLEVPRNTFLKYWKAAIEAVEEFLLNPNKKSVYDEAVEENEPAESNYYSIKLSDRDKKNLLKKIQTPYIAGLFYAVSKLHKRDVFVRKVIETSLYDGNTGKDENTTSTQDGLSSTLHQGTNNPFASPDNFANKGTLLDHFVRGIYFDISLLHFLASYYSQLSTRILSLDDSVFPKSTSENPSEYSNYSFGTRPSNSNSQNPTNESNFESEVGLNTTDLGPKFDSPLLPNLSDYHAQLRLTPDSRCFNFDGNVSTYGAVDASRPKMLRQSFESEIVQLVPVTYLGGPFEEGKSGVWNGAYVAVDGVLKKSKDLWKVL